MISVPTKDIKQMGGGCAFLYNLRKLKFIWKGKRWQLGRDLRGSRTGFLAWKTCVEGWVGFQ